MVVIVTGGAGFVGSHLVSSLLDQGKKVIVLDSLWTGSMENVRRFQDNENYRFINHDVRDAPPSNITAIFPTSTDRITEIFHLACPASPDHFSTSPIEILETCFKGTQHMLDLAVRLPGCVRVLLASTSEIYGDPEVIPQPESYWGNTNSYGPRSCYDDGKRVAESLAFGYQLRHGPASAALNYPSSTCHIQDREEREEKGELEVRIARIFNVYGPWMQVSDGRAVPNFISAAIEGKPLIVYGDGSATRCFQFATDVVRGLELLIRSDYDRPVNIGSDVEMSVGVIAEQIRDLVALKLEQKAHRLKGAQKKAEIVYMPRRQDDPQRRRPDIGVAKEVLGWRPEVPLRDGIEATVDWFLEKSGMFKDTADMQDLIKELPIHSPVTARITPSLPPAISVPSG